MMQPIEEWKPIVGYEGFYEVSNLGRIKRVASGRPAAKPGYILNPRPDKHGYITVKLFKEGQKKDHRVHRLLLLAFVGNPPKNTNDARHLDGDKTNNRLDNLKWGTRQENEQDKNLHGKSNRGERHGFSKLTESQVLEIRRLAAKGFSQRKISAQFNVHQVTVSHIIRRTTWEWLKP